MAQRIPFEMNVPDDIKQIADIFFKNGYKLFIVGGAIRDSLLNKPIKDYDLATDAVPDKVELMMNSNELKTIATGKAFGIINVFTDKSEYEIATFRKDLSGGRRPDAVEFTDIETDVNRRDLTINGLFYDIQKKEIVDLVGGIEDLKNGVVRTIGNPEDRFEEDKLRILRAVRFAGRFGSKLDPKIDSLMKKGLSLQDVSKERIKDEFIKGIKTSKSVKYFLSLIKKYNLFQQILPELNIYHVYIESHDYIITLAVLLNENQITFLQKELNKLTYSIDEIKSISFLIQLKELSEENVVDLKRKQKITNLTENQIEIFAKFMGLSTKLIQRFNQFNLTVNGNDLMSSMNLKPGPELGKAIRDKETENFKKFI